MPRTGMAVAPADFIWAAFERGARAKPLMAGDRDRGRCMKLVFALVLTLAMSSAAHAVDFRWRLAFAQGTFEAIVDNGNDASVNIYCPSGQQDPTPAMFIKSKKVKAVAKEQVAIQIVVDGESYPFWLDEIQFLANSNRAMLDLQSLVYALATSKKKSFTVEFPKYKVSEKFSLLDARKSLRNGKKSILADCDK